MSMKRAFLLLFATVIVCCLVEPTLLNAKAFKVFVVMSYEKENPWCQEIKEGIESALGESSKTSYFYMNTKVDYAGGPHKAKEAFEKYKTLNPDGIITADDNAQMMFVLPYLKGKLSVPLMFCGVNDEARKYGFPTSYISGSEERGHIRETIAFARQLSPAIKSVGFITKESPSGHALKQQIEQEKASYSLPVKAILLAKSLADIRGQASVLRNECSALFVLSIEGLLNDSNKPMNYREVTDHVKKLTSKPILGANSYHMSYGALCAVVKTGNEQGRAAGSMLLRAMHGTPVKNLKVTRNCNGRRYINVSEMRALGIKAKPYALLGAKLLRTKSE